MSLNSVLPLDRLGQSNNFRKKIKRNLEKSNRQPHNFPMTSSKCPPMDALRTYFKGRPWKDSTWNVGTSQGHEI